MDEITKNFGEEPDLVKEKRVYDRFPSRFPAKFKDARQGFGTNIFLRNVSAGGAKITAKEQVYLNDSVTLEVELLDGKDPMILRGEAAWTKSREPDLWDVGLRFHDVVLMDLWRLYKSAETVSRL